MKDLSRAPLNDAEKVLQTVLKRFDLTLNVPLTYIQVSDTCKLPCLMPSDHLASLHDKGFLHTS